MLTSFSDFNLLEPLQRAVQEEGYRTPTPIQAEAIPHILAGRDLLGCAQTGTGKTAAFVLPILNRLSHEQAGKRKVVRSLILTPTRELAVQIEKAIRDYGRFLHLRTLAVYGGVNINGQFSALRQGVDIVVATPGRLLDHMNRRTIDLKHIEVLVLDEADRMFDMGFIKDVRRIISAVPTNRQTMLFSATVTPEISNLASGVQRSPIMIQIGRPRNPIETIKQHIYILIGTPAISLYLRSMTLLQSSMALSGKKTGLHQMQCPQTL